METIEIKGLKSSQLLKTIYQVPFKTTERIFKIERDKNFKATKKFNQIPSIKTMNDLNVKTSNLDEVQEVEKTSLHKEANSFSDKRNIACMESPQKRIQYECHSDRFDHVTDEVPLDVGVGPITYFEKKNDFTISELEKKMETMIVTLHQIQDGENLQAKDEVFEKILSLFENSELYKIDPDS